VFFMAIDLPVDVRALYDMGKRLKEDRERPVRIAVLIEIDAPDSLVEAARAELHPKTSNGFVEVSVIEPGEILRIDSRADVVIVLVGSGANVAATLADARSRAIPTAAVALRDDRAELAYQIGHPESDTLVGTDASELFRGPLADWAMGRLEKLRTALGHNFEFVRRAVARETVQKTAWQNAAVGVLMFLPGADMPIMTLNQGKMLLQIAAAYGQPLDQERIKELAAIVGSGFVLRTVARELLDFVPGFGWAIKGGIAYSGTVAMGNAAIEYFERGADLGGVVRELTEKAEGAASSVSARVTSKRFGRRAPKHADYVEVRGGDAPPAVGAGSRGMVGTLACAPGAASAPSQQTLVDVPVAPPTLVVRDESSDAGTDAGRDS
jgi:uncharacterized protein (DUF697 family)